MDFLLGCWGVVGMLVGGVLFVARDLDLSWNLDC
jgi:hypothetical protein